MREPSPNPGVAPFAGRVLCGGEAVGSGVVVHNSGLIATCWHVIAARPGGGGLGFTTLDGRYSFPVMVDGEPDRRHDLVLLRPADQVRLPALEAAWLVAADCVPAAEPFTVQGTGTVRDPGHVYEFLSATGRIIGPAQRDGATWLAVESRQLLRGMSGGALVSGTHGGVLGLLGERYNPPPGETWMRDTGWAIPADRVAALRPELLTAIRLRRAPSTPPARLAVWHTRNQRRASAFTGREDELRAVRGLLAPGRPGTVAVCGVGGSGKTRLVLEHAHRRSSDYDVVWLARATSLDSDLRELASALALEDSAGDPAAALRGWLATHSRWLLVIDGADDPPAVLDRIPGGAGHVLITSRDTQWGSAAERVSLGALDRPSAVAFLRRRGLTAGEEELQGLAAAVGDLPLALEHAASFLLATARPLSEYRALLDERAAELLADSSSPDYATPIATTWSISFDRLRTEDAAAWELLRLLAFLAPDDLPTETLTADGTLPPRLGLALEDPLRLARTQAHLARYSLAHVTSDSISVHPLVQTVVREIALGSAQRAQCASHAVALLRRSFPAESHDVDHWPACGRLAAHAISAARYAEQSNVTLTEASWLLDRVATYLERRVDSQTAFPHAKKGLELQERSGETDTDEAAARYNNLAMTYFNLDDLPRARELLERALAIDGFRRRRHRQPPHGGRLVNYGVVLYFLGEEGGDPDLHQQGVEFMKQGVANADPSDEYFGLMLLNLAAGHREHGLLDQAAELLEVAEQAERQRFGTDHPSYAAVLEESARLAETRGLIDQAVDSWRTAAAILRERLGPDARQTHRAFLGYFQTLVGDGRTEQALELADHLRTHLVFGDGGTGGEDPSDLLGAVGIFLLRSGRPAKALDWFYDQAALLEACFGPQSWELALAENNIGLTLLDLGRKAEARQALHRAVELAQPRLDRAVPVYHVNYALALALTGDTDGALSHVHTALETDRRNDSNDRGQVLVKAARAEIAASRPHAARAHLREALDLLPTSPLPEALREQRRSDATRLLAALDTAAEGGG
ncbi:FxSxx-COOH system tetratricopeptide repeat protein [Streptomyces sp. NPDC046887]|uniref:FxSxx-COOH system tetratricopeptide repeat protein n=1 Tax=Streptomyces sp. NPDC046887 TaxID=3155472 RepID=UPI0033FBD96F